MAREATGHIKLVERKRGAQWYLKYRLGDRQVQKRLGPAWESGGRPPVGYFTRRTAEEALSALLTDARRGLLDNASTGATFRDAATEYLRYVEQVRKIDIATVKDYRGVIDGYLVNDERLSGLGLKPFSDRPLEAITPDMIDAYKETLIAEGRLSARVIVRHLTVLHGIFKRAKRKYGLADNPASADLVERPEVVYSGEFDTLTGDEIELLAASAADRQDATIYKVAAFTGLRQGELLALRWGEVDFVGGLLHVRKNFTDGREKEYPKGKRVRSVPMIPAVIDALARLKERGYLTEDTDLIFCNTAGDHLDSWALRRRFYRALTKAGLRRIRFHDLRHCFGSAAITKLDSHAVQSYMGHAHYSTTARYLHHKPRPEDAAALHEAFGRDVSRTVSPTTPVPDELSATQEV